jgi:hypothetical protein
VRLRDYAATRVTPPQTCARPVAVIADFVSGRLSFTLGPHFQMNYGFATTG